MPRLSHFVLAYSSVMLFTPETENMMVLLFYQKSIK